jgi:hypothetical protein
MATAARMGDRLGVFRVPAISARGGHTSQPSVELEGLKQVDPRLSAFSFLLPGGNTAHDTQALSLVFAAGIAGQLSR